MPPRYTNEFKEEAAKQVIQNGYTIVEVAEKVGSPSDIFRSLGKTI